MHLPDFAANPGESGDVMNLESEILTRGTCTFYASSKKLLSSTQHAYLSVIIHMAGSFEPILTKQMADHLRKAG